MKKEDLLAVLKKVKGVELLNDKDIYNIRKVIIHKKKNLDIKVL